MPSFLASKSRSVWILNSHALSREEEIKIVWNDFLPADKGSQHQRAYLVAGVQELLLAMFDVQLSSQKHGYSPETIRQRFVDIKSLVRWMIGQEIWGFNRLSATDIIQFFKSRHSRGVGPVNEKTVESWVRLFKRMWDLRSMYRGAIKFNVESIRDEIRGSIVQSRYSPWKAFNEAQALSIIRDALYWFETYGAFLTNATKLSWDDFDRHVGISKGQRAKKRKAFYATLNTDPVISRLRIDLNEPLLPTHKVLSRAVTTMEGALVSLLLILVGFRISELAALNNDCLSEKYVDGEYLPYLQGIAAKRGGLPRQWVACEPIPDAIRYLIDFNARLRYASKTDALFLRRPQGSPISLPAKRTARSTREQLSVRMKSFVTAPFRKDPPTLCHPHMARKTFARLAVKRDKGALEPVAHHLGHAFKWFTDGVYVGFDHEIMELLESEDRKELAATLTDLLSSGTAGKGGASLKRLVFRGKKGLSSLVQELISKGVQVAPCNWGYCVYSVSLSACKGNERGPNEITRTPELCASCSNFSVTEKHREWWNERAKREMEFLRQDGLSEQARRMVLIRLETSNHILSEMSKAGTRVVNGVNET